MNLASMDLNLLVSLDAILTERNLTRAGERLGIPQPTMSHTLRRLRKVFQDELIVRTGREYDLTPLATELYEPLRVAIAAIEVALEKRPVFDPAKAERTFTIAASDYATFLVFQPLIARLHEEAPNVRLAIRPLSHDGVALVEKADIDLAIWPRLKQPDFPHEVLYTDRWVGVAWSGNDGVEDTLSFEQYMSTPQIRYHQNLKVPVADTFLARMFPEGTTVLTIESFFLLPFMLRDTNLIAITHERLARRLECMGGFKILTLLFHAEGITEAMHWHPRFTTDPGHTWLRNLIKECVANLGVADSRDLVGRRPMGEGGA